MQKTKDSSSGFADNSALRTDTKPLKKKNYKAVFIAQYSHPVYEFITEENIQTMHIPRYRRFNFIISQTRIT